MSIILETIDCEALPYHIAKAVATLSMCSKFFTMKFRVAQHISLSLREHRKRICHVKADCFRFWPAQ